MLSVLPARKSACSAHGGQKRLLKFLELELQVVVSCHVGHWHLNPAHL